MYIYIYIYIYIIIYNYIYIYIIIFNVCFVAVGCLVLTSWIYSETIIKSIKKHILFFSATDN